jgi:hypothetical protein
MTNEIESPTVLEEQNTGELAGQWIETREEVQQHFCSILQTVCEPDEKVLGYYQAESNVHFLIKIIPVVPDILTRPKKFCLGVTTKRLIVIRLTNPYNAFALPNFKSMVFAAPFTHIDVVIPKTGLLTSSVLIVSTAGHRMRYDGMLKGSAADFAAEVGVLKRAHEKKSGYAVPQGPAEFEGIFENV